MKRAPHSAGALAAVAALAACGEKPQTLQSGVKVDAPGLPGHRPARTPSPGWKQGDKASWEQQLKTRTQQGQNEYTKVN